MPNAPRTKGRLIRIPDELWADAQVMAADERTDVSKYVREDLERRVKRWRRTREA